MKNFLASAILSISLLASSVTASMAGVLESHSYGSWQLYAWSQNNHFCALKTQWSDGKTLSLRLNSNDGLTLVIFDPYFTFDEGTAPIEVYFDNEYYKTYIEETRPGSPNQVFMNVGFSDDFLNKFKYASILDVQSQDVEYKVDMTGTDHLGEYLIDCVRRYGF
jgi:hypothetical protein